MPVETDETETLDTLITEDERAYRYMQEYRDIQEFRERSAETYSDEDEYDWGWDDSNEILI